MAELMLAPDIEKDEAWADAWLVNCLKSAPDVKDEFITAVISAVREEMEDARAVLQER